MKEILIASSALIAALLVFRRAFQNAISRRVQYALWALVLARLLIPVSLPAVDFSVLTATQPVQAAVTRRMEARPVYVQPVERASISDYPMAYGLEPGDPVPVAETDVGGYVVLDRGGVTVTKYAQRLTLAQALEGVWKLGMAAMALFFLITNLRFWLRLRKDRTPYPVEGCHRPVYLCRGLASPCLFGLFRPAIYLNPAALAPPDSLRHVIAHEETHARHLDPVWSLLRCLCLTVYWFHPLVWVAAWCSKADCELACDEGAMARLGDGERIAYGQTLLSLIPVGRRPANPLLAATTMTAGKRQLKARVLRIAHKRKGAAVAAVTAAALMVGVSACTFTGSKPQAPQALTGDELAFFNEEFFNGGDASVGEMNLRNQFLSSLYEKPEGINLFELFYCDGVTSSPEEDALVYGDALPDCGRYKLTVERIDQVLEEYMGLTLEETGKVGLDGFTYLPEQDAYYWAHGDTNYRGQVTFTAGTREGDRISLYYEDDFMGGGWKCLTLTHKGEGRYWFLSNQPSEKPVIPTALPEGKPELTISLKDLEPYQAPAVTITSHVGDFSGRYEDLLANWDIEGRSVQIYRSTDGNVYAAVVAEDETRNVFLTGLDEYSSMFFYNDLFGHDGFYLSYSGEIAPNTYGTLYDYYYFAEGDDTPVLLARCHAWNETHVIDLDGDGENELAADDQFFFQREGVVYRADIPALLAANWSQIGYVDHSVWDTDAKCMRMSGSLEVGEGRGDPRTFWRDFYYDGKDLLVYKDRRTHTDNLMDGAEAPEEVIAAAKDFVLSQLEMRADGTFVAAGQGDGAVYDDWRIESLSAPCVFQVGELTLQGYSFNYELHTTTPERVGLAGGRYLTEDDWISPGYPGCDWLFFHVNANSGPKYLWHDMINDMSPESLGFQEYLARRVRVLGLDVGNVGYAALDIQNDLDLILDHSGDQIVVSLTPAADGAIFAAQLSSRGPTSMGRGGSYRVSPDFGNLRNRQRGFTDPDTYRWTQVEAPAQIPGGDSLVLAQADWYHMLQFWDGSELVMSKHTNADPVWYRAELVAEDDVFAADIYRYLRDCYDEAEWAALSGDIMIPDQGQSRLEVARAWVEAHEGAMLDMTPGGIYACTYVDSSVELEEDMPEDWFPEEVLDYEHFAISYTTVFIPENDRALMWMMAGNTGEYTGTEPLEGAYEYSRRATMYRTEDGWHCTGIGTG